MDSSPPYILISPIGPLDTLWDSTIDEEISKVFDFPIRNSPLLETVVFALNPERNQYHSTAILDRLAAAAPAGAIRVLAIVRVDLYIPILTHVYGEAQLGGKAGIISTYRLNDNLKSPAVIRNRLFKEAVHELAHTFGLRHCQDHSCIMHYCRSIRDVDLKSERLCRYCNIMLADEIKRLATC